MNQHDSVEARIEQWRQHLLRHATLRGEEADELEDHLRSRLEELREAGLDEEEAFLVAVKRMGELDVISREFAREYSERLWKQLVLRPAQSTATSLVRRDAIVAVGLAVFAAIAVKFPELFGLHLGGETPAVSFYLRNATLLILPLLAVYFAWKRQLDSVERGSLAVPFVAAALLVNAMPFRPEGDTLTLAAIHLPIVLWVAVGFAYVGGRWRDHGQRMNFIRFSGEWFIYYALIAMGGGVLMVFLLLVFESIGLNAEGFVQLWVLPCGAAGAVIISSWLVEAKQNVIENMAPVLTRLFTPLFAALLLVFLGAMLVTGRGIGVERDVLIGFDLLLVVVLALLLYSISARDGAQPPSWFDRLQLLLIVAMLLVDLLALLAISARIGEYGLSPNKLAALGMNMILLVNLGGSTVLLTRFLFGRAGFTTLERWQTAYIPVYALWAVAVVVVFPLLFGFV